jgi:hypothetical protein
LEEEFKRSGLGPSTRGLKVLSQVGVHRENYIMTGADPPGLYFSMRIRQANQATAAQMLTSNALSAHWLMSPTVITPSEVLNRSVFMKIDVRDGSGGPFAVPSVPHITILANTPSEINPCNEASTTIRPRPLGPCTALLVARDTSLLFDTLLAKVMLLCATDLTPSPHREVAVSSSISYTPSTWHTVDEESGAAWSMLYLAIP